MPKNYSFSDFDINFDAHPVRGDITKLVDSRAIIQAVKNLVLMCKYETEFLPDLGANLRKMLFENATPITESIIAQLIAEVINTYEPRVTLTEINISFDESTNGYNITILLLIKNTPETLQTQVFLERLA